ncbi:MAG: phosphate signaling complex protein PhoU [Desulfovibrionales bacterium]
MQKKHLVKSYDQELARLSEKIVELGREAELQLSKAVKALEKENVELAQLVVDGDTVLNDLQAEVDSLTVDILAKRQPMALDLRNVISCQKIAAELERIADYASNISRHIISAEGACLGRSLEQTLRMGDLTQTMLADIIAAYIDMDADKAVQTWRNDDAVDQVFADLLTQLHECMVQNSDQIKSCTTMLFIGRCFERIGDHITNIAESIHYIVTGETHIHKRPNPEEKPLQ